LDERLDLIRAVKETELCMEVEMNEGRRHGRILGGGGRGSQTMLGQPVSLIHSAGHTLITR
jgi:hypothetical protein